MPSSQPSPRKSLNSSKAERRRIVRRIKTRLGCCLCKGKFPHYGLEFHHVNPADKAFGIADGQFSKWKTLILELSKCVVLCRICHNGVTCGELKVPLKAVRAWTYKEF